MPLSKQRDRDRKRQSRLENENVQPNIPLYNPSIHKAGDTVRVLRGKREVVTLIPELDADGRPMPEYYA